MGINTVTIELDEYNEMRDLIIAIRKKEVVLTDEWYKGEGITKVYTTDEASVLFCKRIKDLQDENTILVTQNNVLKHDNITLSNKNYELQEQQKKLKLKRSWFK